MGLRWWWGHLREMTEFGRQRRCLPCGFGIGLPALFRQCPLAGARQEFKDLSSALVKCLDRGIVPGRLVSKRVLLYVFEQAASLEDTDGVTGSGCRVPHLSANRTKLRDREDRQTDAQHDQDAEAEINACLDRDAA